MKKLNIQIINFSLAIFFSILSVIFYKYQTELHKAIATRLGNANIAFIGDSITVRGGVWDWRLGSLLSTVNFGQGGAVLKDISWIAKESVTPLNHFSVVSIMAGTNDASRLPIPSLSLNGDHRKAIKIYIELIEHLQKNGVKKIIITSTPPQSDVEKNKFIKDLNKGLFQYISRSGCCEYIDLWPMLSDGVKIRPAMTTDGVHFSEEAYKIWAKELKKHL